MRWQCCWQCCHCCGNHVAMLGGGLCLAMSRAGLALSMVTLTGGHMSLVKTSHLRCYHSTDNCSFYSPTLGELLDTTVRKHEPGHNTTDFISAASREDQEKMCKESCEWGESAPQVVSRGVRQGTSQGRVILANELDCDTHAPNIFYSFWAARHMNRQGPLYEQYELVLL